MPRPRLLIATTHPWRAAIQVGAHAYARQFRSQGWDVAMVSMPLTPLHVVKMRAPDVRVRFRAWAAPARSPDVDDFTPLSLLPVIGRGLASRGVISAWPRWTLPRLRRQLARHDWHQPDLLLFDSPLFLPMLALVQPTRCVYRVADYLPGFNNVPQLWRSLEEECAARADLVVYTTPALREHVETLRPKECLLIQNGVDVELFERPAPEPKELQAIPRPRAVYVGELREWFDVDAVHVLCEADPRLQVIVIGPSRRITFRPYPNLHLLGERQRAVLPAYLHAADVGIIPFDVRGHRELVEAINPLKLYEYMAAGLPVVTADWPAVAELGSPALRYNDTGDLPRLVASALANRESLSKAGKQWVQRADWAARLAPLWDWVSRPGYAHA